ncbi:hypothetical protein GCM10022393_13980 [Aquimarina addita]|uniref:Uncharacterized protein n=2 Tax=Aquimarina addita TaxID=870485 RepID=A0ABP7XFB7_9FLAO
MNASDLIKTPLTEKEKSKKEKKEVKEEGVLVSRNFHSVKKWKVTIEYNTGDRISKIIVVDDNSELSAMALAFAEAEKYLKTLKNIKDYSVSPVSNNSFVLLAGRN